MTPVTLAGTESRRVQAQANGATYRIGLWLPPGDAPAGGFPAVYVLDANALFASFVEAVRRCSRRPDATGVVPMAVVGIAPDDDALFPASLRERDFAGGPGFLSFLADELAPSLERELPLNATRRMLFGHSLAGYFVLEALAARPATFATWAAISPSIWWDEPGLRARLAAVQPGPRVLIGVGEWEASLAPWQRRQPGHEALVARRAQRRMLENAQALAQQLQGLLGPERTLFRVFPEEDHASVVMVACQRALRFASA